MFLQRPLSRWCSLTDVLAPCGSESKVSTNFFVICFWGLFINNYFGWFGWLTQIWKSRFRHQIQQQRDKRDGKKKWKMVVCHQLTWALNRHNEKKKYGQHLSPNEKQNRYLWPNKFYSVKWKTFMYAKMQNIWAFRTMGPSVSFRFA